MASKILKTPKPVTSEVCSGVFQLSPTNDWAAKLYTSSGLLSFKQRSNEFWSVKSPCKNVTLPSRCSVFVRFLDELRLSTPYTLYPFSNRKSAK